MKANKFVEIHDQCLGYELEILSAVESLGERRDLAYKRKDIDYFKNIIVLLDTIIDSAEVYKQYLEELEVNEE